MVLLLGFTARPCNHHIIGAVIVSAIDVTTMPFMSNPIVLGLDHLNLLTFSTSGCPASGCISVDDWANDGQLEDPLICGVVGQQTQYEKVAACHRSFDCS